MPNEVHTINSQHHTLYIQPLLKKHHLWQPEALGGHLDINHNTAFLILFYPPSLDFSITDNPQLVPIGHWFFLLTNGKPRVSTSLSQTKQGGVAGTGLVGRPGWLAHLHQQNCPARFITVRAQLPKSLKNFIPRTHRSKESKEIPHVHRIWDHSVWNTAEAWVKVLALITKIRQRPLERWFMQTTEQEPWDKIWGHLREDAVTNSHQRSYTKCKLLPFLLW